MLRQSDRPLLPRALWLPALWLLGIDFGHATTASADDAMPQKTLVLPGEVFVAGGHTAFLLTPAAEPLPATGAKPWILYSPTLPGYPDMAEVWMHEQFTKAGVAKAAPPMTFPPTNSPRRPACPSASFMEMTTRSCRSSPTPRD